MGYFTCMAWWHSEGDNYDGNIGYVGGPLNVVLPPSLLLLLPGFEANRGITYPVVYGS